MASCVWPASFRLALIVERELVIDVAVSSMENGTPTKQYFQTVHFKIKGKVCYLIKDVNISLQGKVCENFLLVF